MKQYNNKDIPFKINITEKKNSKKKGGMERK